MGNKTDSKAVLDRRKVNQIMPSGTRVASGRRILIALVAFVSLFIASNITINNTYAADSISLSIDTNTISLDLSPRTATGEFKESSSANISASTTSSSGYTLSIASSTNSTDLTNTTDHTSKITSIESNLTTSDFSNASNTQYNNKWGYKPSQYVTTSGDTHTTHTNTGANAVFKPLPGQAGEILAITEQANQQNSPDTYTISMGARVNNTIPTGSYQSNAFVIMAVANKSTIDCDDTKLCVQFDGNGLTFPETEAQTERVVNNVNYNSVATQQQVTKTLHSDNVGDDGIATGNSAVNTDQTKEATIDGASSVNVSLYYDTEGVKFDWVALYAGADSVPSSDNDGTIGSNGNLTGKLGGNKSGYTTSYTTWNLWNNSGNPINSDTIKVHFRTDGTAGKYISYGYYAIITGTATIRDCTLTSGEYATPTGTNAIFYGWSSTAITPGGGLPSDVEYADETAVKSNMPGDNTETKTLYAVWQQGYPITFTMDSNTSSIAVIDQNDVTVGTITANGQSLVLLGGDTYILKPTYATGYTTNTITIASGAGSLNGKRYTVGGGSATINVTSKVGQTMQDFTASECSAMAVGSTINLPDERDNQAYRIAKLKDGKCWMVENLNIAGGTAISADTSDVTSAYISSFSTSNNLTKTGDTIVLPASSTSGFDTNNYSYVYNSGNKTNCGASGQNTPCYSYYSWDAATLGSGRTISTDNTDAQQSICPKGWKLPTSRTTSATNWQTTSDFYALAHQYGLDSTTSTSESDNGFYTQAGPGTTPDFLLAGRYNYGSFSNGGSSGAYWSSTSFSSTDNARYLYFNSSNVDSAYYNYRRLGYSVRCLLAE